ncbi:hypothetical protein RIF29_24746 [Crotalaria pallida]|uniref:Uncharacterized protein n=1 Tax=Crotalaria pallida TaxID=3830 RepID=A0AAN9HYQ4_CROPI
MFIIDVSLVTCADIVFIFFFDSIWRNIYTAAQYISNGTTTRNKTHFHKIMNHHHETYTIYSFKYQYLE